MPSDATEVDAGNHRTPVKKTHCVVLNRFRVAFFRQEPASMLPSSEARRGSTWIFAQANYIKPSPGVTNSSLGAAIW